MPIEFAVVGIPISSQATTKKIRQWKERVSTSARSALAKGTLPYIEKLHVEVTHFYEGGTIDLDNLAKPLLDALKGVTYVDDVLIDSLHLRRIELSTDSTIHNVNSAIASALETGGDFVYVFINRLEDGGAIKL